jgi:hypothetical protein
MLCGFGRGLPRVFVPSCLLALAFLKFRTNRNASRRAVTDCNPRATFSSSQSRHRQVPLSKARQSGDLWNLNTTNLLVSVVKDVLLVALLLSASREGQSRIG